MGPLEPIEAWRCSPPWTRQSATAAAVSLAWAPRRAASRAYLRWSTRMLRAHPQLGLLPCMASRKAAAHRPSKLCDTVELAAPIHNNGVLTMKSTPPGAPRYQAASGEHLLDTGGAPRCRHGARTELQTVVRCAPESGRLLLPPPVVSTSLRSPSSILSHVPPNRSPSSAGCWRLERADL
jgi:hypothetical protein